jgi:hypothetical protein
MARFQKFNSRVLSIILTILTISIANTALARVVLPPNIIFCGQPQISVLLAGQNINVGTITVTNDNNGNIYITYKTVPNATISETHLAVATSLSGIPQTSTGNPKNGLFPYSGSYNPPVTEVNYVIHPGDAGYPVGTTALYIAAHAVVNITGTTTKQETAWGKGETFPGKNWAMYFKYQLQPCSPPPPPPTLINPGDFRTQTQGGWGGTCQGQNPACYRDSHFSVAFPYGLVIGNPGSGGTKATFQNAAAIEQFLPQGGTPNSLLLGSNDINPLTTQAGVLAGQVTALALSLQFDIKDPAFGASAVLLKDLVVKDNTSACYNMTVQQVLDAANNTLAKMPGSMIPSSINQCVDNINNNFDNGTVVGNFLRLP